MTPNSAVRVAHATKLYRRYGRRRTVGTLKTALLSGAGGAPAADSAVRALTDVSFEVAPAETVGIVQFQIGPGKVLLQPMVWALLIAAAWGLSARYLPAAARIFEDQRLHAITDDLT